MRFKSLLILIIALKFGDVWKKACLTDSRDYKIGLGELFIRFSDYDTRSADILQDLGLDTFEQRRSKQPAISVFKYLNNPNFNPFQSSSVLPIPGICCFCYVILTFL